MSTLRAAVIHVGLVEDIDQVLAGLVIVIVVVDDVDDTSSCQTAQGNG